jgi:YHS domain-containing protein
LERLRGEVPQQVLGDVVSEDVICGMAGHREHSVEYRGRTYLFCNAQHARQFKQDPQEYASRLAPAPRPKGPGAMPRRGGEVETRDLVCGMSGLEEHSAPHEGREYRFCSEDCREAFEREPARYIGVEEHQERQSAWSLRTWYEVTQEFIGDIKMLRNELIAGYLIAGFAEALIPHQWFSHSLQQIGHVPVIGYLLLLLLGLLIAVATFVCSMGNVPVAQFLKVAGVPLGANTAYIYGDLLILPLVQIYRKSFAPQLTAAFLGLFVLGAMIAGGLMELLISHLPGGL